MKTFTSLDKNRIIKILLPAGFWLAVWFIASFLVNQNLLIPSPVLVASRWCELITTKIFWMNISRTLYRILSGSLAGIIAGSLFAVLCYSSEAVNYILYPAIKIIRSTPVASFIVLILLWTGKNQVPIVISCLTALPIIFENIYSGLSGVDLQLLEMADMYEFGNKKKIKLIWIPALKNSIISGINNAIGLSWKSGVAAEVLCIPKYAIGTQIYNSKLYLETPSLFAWTFTVIILSLGIELLVHKIIKRS